MPLNPIEQAAEQIKKSQKIILTLSHKAKIDSIVAVFALEKYLKYMGKKITIVADEDLIIPKKIEFLPRPDIQNSLKNLNNFIIYVDTSKTKASELSYNVKNDHLEIIIKPGQGGNFLPEDVSFPTNIVSDIIITVGVADLEDIGKIYQDNTEFFYEHPIINIDHSPDNVSFGQINFVDISATSSSEMLFQLFDKINPKYIDSNIATYLLTGIIAQTRSFRTRKVTPKSLKIAAELIKLEAKREEIVKNLYRTRTLSTLKLWGRVLARLEHDKEHQLVWSLLNHYDFVKTKTSEEDLFDIIDELIVNIHNVEIVVLFYEKENHNVSGIIYTTNKNLNCYDLILSIKLNGGKNIALFEIGSKELTQVEYEVVNEIKENLEKIKMSE